MGSILGNRVLRVEDPRMLTVGGTYVEDVELAGRARFSRTSGRPWPTR